MAVVLGALSCGQDPGDTVITSHDDLCAGAAPEYAAGYAVAEECPFVQQVTNISTFGSSVPQGSVIADGHGTVTGSVTHSCDAWMLGTDPDGVTIIVQRDLGKVIAHGNVHPGQALSKVHSPMALPVAVK
jgi:hypothetical protein